MSLQISNLGIQRGDRLVLRDASLQLQPGRVLAVLGANGAGKSSLVGAISGEIEPFQGNIRFDSSDVTQLSVAQQARVRAVLLQNSELNFPFKAVEVVAMGAYPFQEASPHQVDEWIDQALLLADAHHLRTRRYEELSGGEQRRIQLARVLVQCLAMEHCEGRVYLLLDEPLANMDPKHQLLLIKRLHELAHSRQFAILIVMHDVNLASFCDEILLIADQTVIAQGNPADVLTAANLRRVFDMEMSVLAHPLDSNRILVLPMNG